MAGGGSTTRRGGRQKGTPNKATTARRQSIEAGQRALEAMTSGDAATIADVRRAIEQEEHMNVVDQADGTLTETQALTEVSIREHKYYATALEYLQDTYRDSRLPRGLRQDAAKAAIRYETPALSNIAVKQEEDPDKVIRDADSRDRIEHIVESVLLRANIPLNKRVTDVVDLDQRIEQAVRDASGDDSDGDDTDA